MKCSKDSLHFRPMLQHRSSAEICMLKILVRAPGLMSDSGESWVFYSGSSHMETEISQTACIISAVLIWYCDGNVSEWFTCCLPPIFENILSKLYLCSLSSARANRNKGGAQALEHRHLSRCEVSRRDTQLCFGIFTAMHFCSILEIDTGPMKKRRTMYIRFRSIYWYNLCSK